MATGGSDRVCPSCEEPIGARSTFCMHCGADLPEPTDDAAREESDGSGESLLTRLRPGTAAESTDGRAGGATRSANADRRSATTDAESALGSDVASGGEPVVEPATETDGRTDASDGIRSWLPTEPRHVAATAGAAALLSLFAFSTTVPGALAALLAWLAFSVVVYAREPGADAVPKIAAGFVLFTLFVPIGVIFARDGGAIAVASGLAMVLVPTLFALWHVLVE